MTKIDTSYTAYQEYMSNMIVQDKPNILDYDEWLEMMTIPMPEEYQITTQEITYKEAEELGVVWASEQELREMGLIDE
ncbi:hypothetical protein ACGTJS_04415 [Faucicola mancuniensis]|uniref:hypothetical protein n=1 Tax=Faucicola mancuniensis TaxID=1309795 RepID=UPI0039776620